MLAVQYLNNCYYVSDIEVMSNSMFALGSNLLLCDPFMGTNTIYKYNFVTFLVYIIFLLCLALLYDFKIWQEQQYWLDIYYDHLQYLNYIMIIN